MIRPTVDIIIPYHAQYERVTRLVGSIYSCTPNQKYKIILVDDASPNSSHIRHITQGKNSIGIRLDEHSGYGAALKAGFERGSSSHVVFLHSDVTITSINWLISLQRSLEEMKSSGVKIVSARSNNPGTAASYDERMIGGQGENIDDFVSECALPLFCSYCHRELFDRIGGFIKPYPYGWYEEEELFWRMKYYGYAQGVCGRSWVDHHGGATVKGFPPKIRKVMEQNRESCLHDIRHFVKSR